MAEVDLLLVATVRGHEEGNDWTLPGLGQRWNKKRLLETARRECSNRIIWGTAKEGRGTPEQEKTTRNCRGNV